jgi:hypothetical protein
VDPIATAAAPSRTSGSVLEQDPADLEGDKGVDGGVLDLLVGERARVPGAGPHPVRLLHVDEHDDARDVLEAGVVEVRAVHHLRRELAQVHLVGDLQPVVVPETVGVALHADADEAVVGLGEEVGQRVGEVVGVEELDDEAAAADAELEERGGAVVGAEGGPPLDVETHDELVQAAAVDGADLVEPVVDGIAGGRHGGRDRVALELHVVHLGLSHGIPPRVLPLSLSLLRKGQGCLGKANQGLQ